MGADSLAFLTVNGIYRAIGMEAGRNAAAPQLSDHCFTGEYPTPLPDLEEFAAPYASAVDILARRLTMGPQQRRRTSHQLTKRLDRELPSEVQKCAPSH